MRRFPVHLAGALAAAALVVCLSIPATVSSHPLPGQAPFHVISLDDSGTPLSTGQGFILSGDGVAVIHASVLAGASEARLVLAGGGEAAAQFLDAVDVNTGLAMLRLEETWAGTVPVPESRPMASEGQMVTTVTVDGEGRTLSAQFSVKDVEEVPHLPGLYHMEGFLELPPPAGGIYDGEGRLLAVVLMRFDDPAAGVVASTQAVLGLMESGPRKESISIWSSGQPSNWNSGLVATYLRAHSEMRDGRHLAAIELLEPLVSRAGHLEGPFAALLGVSYLAVNLVPESIVAFKSALDKGVSTCDVYQNLAWAYLESGQYREARHFSEKVVEELGDSPVGYLLLARLSNVLGAHDKAVYNARRALKRAPECQCAHYERGTAYLGQRRYEAAIRSLLVAASLDPEDPDTLFGLGYAYLRNGQAQRALEPLQQAVNRDRENLAAWKALGEASSVSGREKEALEAYRQAVCADPADQLAYCRLSQECMRQGLHEEAIRVLGEAIAVCGATDWLTYKLGKALCCSGRFPEAMRQAERLETMNTALADQLRRYIALSGGG